MIGIAFGSGTGYIRSPTRFWPHFQLCPSGVEGHGWFRWLVGAAVGTVHEVPVADAAAASSVVALTFAADDLAAWSNVADFETLKPDYFLHFWAFLNGLIVTLVLIVVCFANLADWYLYMFLWSHCFALLFARAIAELPRCWKAAFIIWDGLRDSCSFRVCLDLFCWPPIAEHSLCSLSGCLQHHLHSRPCHDLGLLGSDQGLSMALPSTSVDAWTVSSHQSSSWLPNLSS